MLNSMENMLTDVRVGRVKLIRFLCGVSPASEILENQCNRLNLRIYSAKSQNLHVSVLSLLFKECSRYKVISDADRSQTYEYKNVQDAKPICDRRLPKAWYRFSGLAGDKMSNECVPPYHCGTHAPGWLLGAHPEVSDGVVTRTVCFSWRNKCCRWRSQISVRNCGDFYVYKLQRAPKCKLRYCGVGKQGTTTTPGPTTNPIPTAIGKCDVVLCCLILKYTKSSYTCP